MLQKMMYYCVFKIDRLYDWKKSPDTDVAVTLKKQKKNTKDEFEERAKAIIVEFAKQVGWNVQVFSVNGSGSKDGAAGVVVLIASDTLVFAVHKPNFVVK